ncbi:MAG: hypothetical protein HZB38_16525 [Planctomycetes bacterium]|nr:hypothetical protein [Planctomycetota bacterium]
MPNETPPPTPPTIRCLRCNYDLRGLSGDPIRCPECGGLTSFAEYAAAHRPKPIAAQFSILAAFSAIPLLAAFGLTLADGVDSGAFCCILASAPWFFALGGAWFYARGTLGWFRIFLRHQLYTVLTVAAVFILAPLSGGVVMLSVALTDNLPARPIAGICGVILGAVGFAALLWMFSRLFEYLTSRATRSFDDLAACRPRRERET